MGGYPEAALTSCVTLGSLRFIICSPHVNFVSGTNGSGKSAVLQGLQCALGASARETGRGTKLEDLVRSGQDEATVQVSHVVAKSEEKSTRQKNGWVLFDFVICGSEGMLAWEGEGGVGGEGGGDEGEGWLGSEETCGKALLLVRLAVYEWGFPMVWRAGVVGDAS
jgi:hypothetical protein